MNSTAEEFKVNGNKAFAEKEYEDAIALYTKAIESDPANFTYYNNRAAAHHELKNYDEAIQDAEKSILIKNNAKAHARIGTALWAQGKLEEASVEYKHSLALNANNENVKNSIKILDEMLEMRRSSYRRNPADPAAAQVMMNGVPLPPLCGGEFISGPVSDVGAGLAILVIIISSLFILSSVLKTMYVIFFWRCLMCVTILQHGLNIYFRGMVPRKVDDFKFLMRHLSPLLLGLCSSALLLGIPSQIFLALFILVYALVDLLNHRSRLLMWVGRYLQDIILCWLNYIEKSRYHLLLVAALFEAMLVIPIMFSSGAIFTFFYIQYIKTRYVYDRYMQVAFSNLRQRISNLTSAPFIPVFVNEYVQKFFDMLYLVSQQGI